MVLRSVVLAPLLHIAVQLALLLERLVPETRRIACVCVCVCVCVCDCVCDCVCVGGVECAWCGVVLQVF